jgi:hypothetical protein
MEIRGATGEAVLVSEAQKNRPKMMKNLERKKYYCNAPET